MTDEQFRSPEGQQAHADNIGVNEDHPAKVNVNMPY